MGSSILRWIGRKAGANSPNYSLPRTMSVVSNGTSKSTTSPSRISPWLMLPPAFEEGKVHNINNNMVNYKFYSLGEKKVLSFSGKNVGLAGDDIRFISSSHGWLTLFNRSNCDLFLCNPLSGRHIKLPPIHTLPIPKRNLRGGFGCVIKLITSCSPEEQDCRVMMSFGTEHRLAFCSPTSSAEWTPIGALYQDEDDDDLTARVYENFVYSSRRKLFYCITQWEDLEAWDLQDIGSPNLIPMEFSVDEENYPWAAQSKEELELKKLCYPLKFLVVEEESGDLFLVRRHVVESMAPDGSYFDYSSDKVAAGKLPYKTIGFDVHKYDPDKCAFRYMDGGSLDGLVFFIGSNHSFAISVAEEELSEVLKPNSIYFTDVHELIPAKWEMQPYGGHDLGIFNYEDRTFSSCYYPCDRKSIQSIFPAPMWFTPTQPNNPPP